MNSLVVTEIIARSIENGCKEIVRKSIMMCSEKYGFDASDALEYLNLSGLKLERKVMRRSKGKKEKVKKVPMPFSREMVSELCCQGIRYNGGLFTQCENDRSEKGCSYCNTCNKEGESNGTGKPDNGSIEDRMKVEIMDYKDNKGRSPKEYLKVLKKLNIGEEEARREAGKKNYIINEMHFEKEKVEKVKKEKGEKGRPKKEKKEVEAQVVSVKEDVIVAKKDKKEKKEKKVKEVKEVKEVKVDLFAELASETSEVKVEEKKKTTKKSKKVEFTETEKEDTDAEEKAKKDAEEQAKKDAEEQAKKDAEEQAKKDAEEQAKKESDKKKVSVTRFEFEGKKYLKSSENILYDADTKEEMGIWCEETKSIKELPDDDEEEMEEEEYDE
jgi:chemotaxis protein histidine kinase CheA